MRSHPVTKDSHSPELFVYLFRRGDFFSGKRGFPSRCNKVLRRWAPVSVSRVRAEVVQVNLTPILCPSDGVSSRISGEPAICVRRFIGDVCILVLELEVSPQDRSNPHRMFRRSRFGFSVRQLSSRRYRCSIGDVCCPLPLPPPAPVCERCEHRTTDVNFGRLAITIELGVDLWTTHAPAEPGERARSCKKSRGLDTADRKGAVLRQPASHSSCH